MYETHDPLALAPQNPTAKPESGDHVARPEDHVLHISRQAMMKTYHDTTTRQKYGNMAHEYKNIFNNDGNESATVIYGVLDCVWLLPGSDIL